MKTLCRVWFIFVVGALFHICAMGATVTESVNADLKNIDFRASVDGTGTLILILPSDQTVVNMRQQGSDIIVDILRTTLPSSLKRILDVSDYCTPMKIIMAEQIGENVRLTIKPVAQYEQSAFQVQNQFILELYPVKDEGLTPSSGYKGELLTMNFQDVDIRTLLQDIANFTDFNVVISDSVRGNLTLRLQDVPWEQALDIVMQAKGLAADRNGNVLWIAPRDEIRQMQQERIESMHESETMEPLRTQVFQLNYAQAQVIMDALTGADSDIKSTQLLSERGSIVMDADTNQLIVTDTPSRLERFASVIVQIDIPVQQVMIEARLVEATDGWGRNLDTRMRARLQHRDNQFIISDTLSRQTNDYECDANGQRDTSVQDMSNMFSLSFSNIEEQGGYSFTFPKSFARYLQLELQALESENYGRIIRGQRLMTTDRVTARSEQTFLTTIGCTLAIGRHDAGPAAYDRSHFIIDVTPRITPNGRVELNILIERRDFKRDRFEEDMINRNHVYTIVVVEEGGTVVIGGVHSLFSPLEDKKELILFITPRIIHEDNKR